MEKPIVAHGCLKQCSNEHRVVPQESYKVLPFSGLRICVTGIPTDKRKEIEKIILQNGGKFSARLTKKCTHLISDAPEGCKHKAAKRWGQIHIVTMKWFDQSIAQRACLDEESYPVQSDSFSARKVTRDSTAQHSHKKDIGKMQYGSSSRAADSKMIVSDCVKSRYLAECRILLVGFEASEMQKLVNMVHKGGGSRCLSFNAKLTHIVIGNPTEMERKNVRSIIALGEVYAVNTSWLEDCDREKKQVPALRGHSAYDLVFPKANLGVTGIVPINEESYPVPSESFSSRKVTRDSTAQHSQKKDNGKMQYGSSSRAADSKMIVSDCVKSRYLADCRILLVGFEASELQKLVNMVQKGGGSRCLSFNDKLTHIVIGNPTEMERKNVRNIIPLGEVYAVNTSWLEDCDRKKKQVPALRGHSAYDLVFPKANLVVTGIVPMDQSKSSSGRQSFQTDQVVGITDFGVKMPEFLEKNKQEKHDMGMNVVTFDKALGRTMPQTQLPDQKLKAQKITQRDSNVHVKSTNVFKGKTFCFSDLFPEERREEIVQWISQGGGEIISGQTKQRVHYTIECHGVKARSTGDYESTYISSHWIKSCMEDGCLLDIDSHILYSPLPCRVPLPGFKSLRFCVSQYENKDRILLLNLCKVLGAEVSEMLTKKVTHLLCKFTNGPKYEASVKWGIQSNTSEWIFECVKQNGVISFDQFLPKDNMLKDAPEAAHAVSPDIASEIEGLVEMVSKHGQRSPGNTGCEGSVSLCDQFNGGSIVGEDNPNHPNPHTVFRSSTLLNRCYWFDQRDTSGV